MKEQAGCSNFHHQFKDEDIKEMIFSCTMQHDKHKVDRRKSKIIYRFKYYDKAIGVHGETKQDCNWLVVVVKKNGWIKTAYPVPDYFMQNPNEPDMKQIGALSPRINVGGDEDTDDNEDSGPGPSTKSGRGREGGSGGDRGGSGRGGSSGGRRGSSGGRGGSGGGSGGDRGGSGRGGSSGGRRGSSGGRGGSGRGAGRGRGGSGGSSRDSKGGGNGEKGNSETKFQNPSKPSNKASSTKGGGKARVIKQES